MGFFFLRCKFQKHVCMAEQRGQNNDAEERGDNYKTLEKVKQEEIEQVLREILGEQQILHAQYQEEGSGPWGECRRSCLIASTFYQSVGKVSAEPWVGVQNIDKRAEGQGCSVKQQWADPLSYSRLQSHVTFSEPLPNTLFQIIIPSRMRAPQRQSPWFSSLMNTKCLESYYGLFIIE